MNDQPITRIPAAQLCAGQTVVLGLPEKKVCIMLTAVGPRTHSLHPCARPINWIQALAIDGSKLCWWPQAEVIVAIT